MKHELQLLEGETILWEDRPLRALKNYFIFEWTLGGSLILLFTVVGAIFIPLLYILAKRLAEKAYEERYYWITNKRVVYRRGILGYKISSIPLERISDVIISRTFLENYFKFGSLQIQSLAGQISTGTAGSEGDLKAVRDPEKVQKIILEELKKVRNSI